MENRTRYPSDLSDGEWAILEPLLPAWSGHGRRPTVARREVINAIFYILRTGCQWRYLPAEFPNWNTVYWYFARWLEDGTWEQVNDALRRQVRVQRGRDPEPSAAILDSQSTKTTEKGGDRGYDAGKKVKGRKRHILVDTEGLVIRAVVLAADIQDRDGATDVCRVAQPVCPRLEQIWADAAYRGSLVEWVKAQYGWRLAIITRANDQQGFAVQPRRWVVERTFGWLGRYRRLSKDYEEFAETTESWIYAAMIRLMLGRLVA